MLQGAGGAMMSPVGRLVMLRVVSKAELVRSMAWLMIPATIGPIVGPPVGGFIVTYLSWHWIFYINVPIGILGVILVTIFIDEMKEPVRQKFDLLGLVLAGTALSCLMFGIEVASRGVGSRLDHRLLVGVGALAAGLYCAACAPRRAADARLPAAAGDDVPDFVDVRVAVAHRRGRDAVPAAHDVPDRLRPVGGAEWPDHVHQFGRVIADAHLRAVVPASAWGSGRC